jgi:hypothetical protein
MCNTCNKVKEEVKAAARVFLLWQETSRCGFELCFAFAVHERNLLILVYLFL